MDVCSNLSSNGNDTYVIGLRSGPEGTSKLHEDVTQMSMVLTPVIIPLSPFLNLWPHRVYLMSGSQRKKRLGPGLRMFPLDMCYCVKVDSCSITSLSRDVWDISGGQ